MRKFVLAIAFVSFFMTGILSGNAGANSCASLNPATNVWHVPGINLYGTSFWADMVITDSSKMILEVIAQGPNGAQGNVAEYAFFDSSTSTLTIPCVNIGNLTCWLDTTLVGQNPFRLQVKGYSCVPAACQRVTDLSQKLEVSVLANGEVTGEAGSAKLRNLTGETLYAWLRPGISMTNSSSSDRQNMTIISSECVEVPPFATVTRTVNAACINGDKSSPDEGDTLTVKKETRSDLVALTQAIDRWLSYGLLNDYNLYNAQLSIWVITDNIPFSEIAEFLPSDSVNQMRALFRAAGLDPNKY
jgi:hypothetical protein